MPLSELLPKSFRTKQNFHSDLPSFGPNEELAELLWENGQVVVQGQTQRSARLSSSPPASSSEKDIGPLGLPAQEEDLPPWPNFPMEDYCLEFFSDFAVPDGSPEIAAKAGPSRSDPGESSLVDPVRDEENRRVRAKRKRLSPEPGDSDFHSEDREEEKKVSPSARRSRAAEVHNMSERRRRDRINEKLRALQELIPNCNKVDKASVLDEAIEYLKFLQMQLQVMSMGCGIYVPPMIIPPGMRFSPMGMGFGLAMVDPTGFPHVRTPPPHIPPAAFPFAVDPSGRHVSAAPPVPVPLTAAALPARVDRADPSGGTRP